DMQRAEPELLAALAKGPKPASDALASRCQAISNRVMQNPRDGAISLGTVAALLLTGSARGVTVEEQMAVQLYTWMLYQPVFQKNALGGLQSPLLKKLLARWVVREGGAPATVQNLLFAASYDLKTEGVLLAKRALADEHNQPNARQYALLVMGRFGG